MNNDIISFILGVTPNFLGAIMVYLTLLLIPKISKLKAFLFTFSLVLFMELERFYNQNIPFDVYDITSSLTALLIVHYIHKSQNI